MNKILVTGAGALLGQGILRCINAAKKKYYIVSADPDIYSSGHALADISYQIPLANDPEYLQKVEEIIYKEEIDLIFIGTDVELPIYAENRDYLENKFALKVVVSDLSVIEIANNKWLTAEFLRENDFPFPKSALTTDKQGIESLRRKFFYPFIAKPVDGARSKGLKIIRNNEDLQEVCSFKNNLVVQELINEEEGEYTTGCIVLKGKCVAVVSLTRELRDGNTWKAFRNEKSKYDSEIAKIAERLRVEGPVNFQYRIRNGEPVIFEINCRFSGTTPLRMIFGFNEVEAIIEHFLNQTPIEPPNLRNGTILRTFSDVFIQNEVLDEFQKKNYLENFRSEYFPFKMDQ